VCADGNVTLEFAVNMAERLALGLGLVWFLVYISADQIAAFDPLEGHSNREMPICKRSESPRTKPSFEIM
jgi:hypothetical protein